MLDRTICHINRYKCKESPELTHFGIVCHQQQWVALTWNPWIPKKMDCYDLVFVLFPVTLLCEVPKLNYGVPL